MRIEARFFCFSSFFLYSALAKTEFNFIMANYFVQTTRGDFYPAELALIKFNLSDGLIHKYHQYLNPREFDQRVFRFQQIKK